MWRARLIPKSKSGGGWRGGKSRGMDVQKIHGVSGSLPRTEATAENPHRHVRRAQVHRRASEEKKKERVVKETEFWNIPERNSISANTGSATQEGHIERRWIISMSQSSGQLIL